MLDKTQFWLLTAIGIVSLVLVVVNMTLFQHNRSAQIEVGARQQYIQQSMQLQVLYTELVKGMADLAVRTQDTELANLLTSHGVALKTTPAAPAKPAAPAEANKGGK